MYCSYLLLSVALPILGVDGLFMKLKADLSVFNNTLMLVNHTQNIHDAQRLNQNITEGDTSNWAPVAHNMIVAPSAKSTAVSSTNSTDSATSPTTPTTPDNATTHISADNAMASTTPGNDTAPTALVKNMTSTTSVNVEAPTASVNTTAPTATSASPVDATSDTNSTRGNVSAASINTQKGFNETKYLKEESNEVPGATKQVACERGFRPVFGICVKSKFTRSIIGSINPPPCDEDKHCPMNSICDPGQHLCKCVNGQPLDEERCDASDLGGRCDNFGSKPEDAINVKCKSLWFECAKGVCSCPKGQYRQKSSCIPLLSLDNNCDAGGIPCRGNEVACLDSHGGTCGRNASCTCSCNVGFVKNAEKKTCEKRTITPSSKIPKENISTTATTTATTTTTKSTQPNRASTTHSYFFLCGLGFIMILDS